LNPGRKNLLFWLIAIFILVVDQISKYLISINVGYHQVIVLINNVLEITYIINNGAAFSLLRGQRWFFVVATTVVFMLIICLHKYIAKQDTVFHIALALFCGGAAGNFIDRLRFGGVIDFVDMQIWPIFNVADSCIVIGVIIIGLKLLISETSLTKTVNGENKSG